MWQSISIQVVYGATPTKMPYKPGTKSSKCWWSIRVCIGMAPQLFGLLFGVVDVSNSVKHSFWLSIVSIWNTSTNACESNSLISINIIVVTCRSMRKAIVRDILILMGIWSSQGATNVAKHINTGRQWCDTYQDAVQTRNQILQMLMKHTSVHWYGSSTVWTFIWCCWCF
jgi:hypothetical protein